MRELANGRLGRARKAGELGGTLLSLSKTASF